VNRSFLVEVVKSKACILLFKAVVPYYSSLRFYSISFNILIVSRWPMQDLPYIYLLEIMKFVS
jgi:hypothetical protein